MLLIKSTKPLSAFTQHRYRAICPPDDPYCIHHVCHTIQGSLVTVQISLGIFILLLAGSQSGLVPCAIQRRLLVPTMSISNGSIFFIEKCHLLEDIQTNDFYQERVSEYQHYSRKGGIHKYLFPLICTFLITTGCDIIISTNDYIDNCYRSSEVEKKLCSCHKRTCYSIRCSCEI